MNERQADTMLELLRKISTRQDITNALLKKISRQLAENQKTPRGPNASTEAKKDHRVAVAVVAIARGASTYQAIADELGVSRATVSKNPAIRRAMEASVRDRSVCSDAAEEFKFQKGR
jgi:hypothetical protein